MTKELIEVAVAHTTQCPYCIRTHTRLAYQKGASDEQITEAIWVAAELQAGGAYMDALIALDALGDSGRGGGDQFVNRRSCLPSPVGSWDASRDQ